MPETTKEKIQQVHCQCAQCVIKRLRATPDSAPSDQARDMQTGARHPSSQKFHDILNELGALHDKKQADYGRADDPFANFRGSEEWGVPAWIGAMIRASDKVRRLQTFARNGSLANEGVIDSLDDLAVYSTIARVLFEEEQNKKQQKLGAPQTLNSCRMCFAVLDDPSWPNAPGILCQRCYDVTQPGEKQTKRYYRSDLGLSRK